MKGVTFAVILVVMSIYLVLGGVMFHYLEKDQAKESYIEAQEFISKFLSNNTCITKDEFIELLRKSCFILHRTHGVIDTNDTDTIPATWDLYSSIFFSATVLTTIGYGNIVPHTPLGKAVCMAYAMVGIPFFLVIASNIGERLHIAVKQHRKCYFKLDKNGNEGKHAKICSGVCYVLIGIGLFIFVPGVIFSLVEQDPQWTLEDGWYYAFVTLTTVGFGDFVAGTAPNSSYIGGNRGLYQLCTAAWIFVGLSWMAGLIASLQDIYSKNIAVKEKEATNLQLSKLRHFSTTSELFGRGKKSSSVLSIYNMDDEITANGFVLRQSSLIENGYIISTRL